MCGSVFFLYRNLQLYIITIETKKELTLFEIANRVSILIFYVSEMR